MAEVEGGASVSITQSGRKCKADVEHKSVISTITKHQTRQKRRSSFMRGRSRKSLPSVNVECSEIHKKIATDLPEEKKLEQLNLACLEYTMQKLQGEIPLFSTDRDLQCKMRRAFEDTLTDVAASGVLAQSCKKNSFEPNPINLEMNEVVIKIQSHVRQLTEETNRWDQLLQEHTDAAQEAEKLDAPSTETEVSTKAPDSLTIKQRRVLSELPDLDAIVDWARNSAEEVSLQIDKVHQTARQMRSFKDSMEQYLNGELKQFAIDSFDGYKDIADPKSLLLKVGTNVHDPLTGTDLEMDSL